MKKRNNYYNCFMMALMSLFEMNSINTKYLINNLNFEVVNDNRKIRINTDELLFLNTIKNDYNIELSRTKYIDLKSEINIYNALKTQGQIIAMVDIYHLPYCIYYKKHHEKHSVLLSYNKEDDVIEVSDYYYGYFGLLSRDSLECIMNQSNDTIKNGISVFRLMNIENISYEINFKKVLKRNIESYYRNSNKDKLFGLKAIDKLRNHLNELELDNYCNNDYLESIYVSIKDVAMYRDGFSKFASIHNSEELEKTCKKMCKGMAHFRKSDFTSISKRYLL